MADPRFYHNRGPFTLAELCAKAEVGVPDDADAGAAIADLASLDGAGASHLTFYTGAASLADEFAQSHAGFCFIQRAGKVRAHLPAMVTIPAASAAHAFAAAAAFFYPDSSSLAVWSRDMPVHPTAEIGARVTIAPGALVGPGAAIGEGTRLGPYCAIGRGVHVGRDCEIGGGVHISHAYIGDAVTIFPGAQIGQPGFGFASDAAGHIKIPQLGRVIIQDRVEIGACTTIDRGALGDTVIGEGTKLDNLVQIGHNSHVGRHCIMAGQAGLAGSCVVGDFVIIGGQSAIAEHSRIGDRARLAGRTATFSHAVLAGGMDHGGLPAKSARDWMREIVTLTALAKHHKRDDHD